MTYCRAGLRYTTGIEAHDAGLEYIIGTEARGAGCGCKVNHLSSRVHEIASTGFAWPTKWAETQAGWF